MNKSRFLEDLSSCFRHHITRAVCRLNNLVGNGVGASAVTLLRNGKLDTLALGQGDPRLLGANDEDVGLAGSKGVVNSVLDVDDVETTIVTLTVGNNTNTTHVTTTSNHGDVANLELDKVVNPASGKATMGSQSHAL